MADTEEQEQAANPPAVLFPKDLIDHAVRRWQAECDNAKRLQTESYVYITALVAIVGFSLFKGWIPDLWSMANFASPWGAWFTRVLFACAAYQYKVSSVGRTRSRAVLEGPVVFRTPLYW